MHNKYTYSLLVLALFYSCKQDSYLTRIEGNRLEINDTLKADKAIEDYIEPFRAHINKNLDSVISYAIDTYSKTDGELNTAIGNLMADMVFEQSNPIFKLRTGKEIDMVLLNHGGIRSIIPKGNITKRTAFEVMPFENIIVVVEMKGKYINELIDYLKKGKRAHPISKLKLKLDQDFELVEATIKGSEIDEEQLYYVATVDYLYYGGDRMHFLTKGDSLYILDYKLRNALIDYFIKKDTLNPVRDDRFTQTN